MTSWTLPLAIGASLALAQGGTNITRSPSAQSPLRPEAHVRRNVLLIVLDDVGIDKIAMYGQTNGPYMPLPYSCDHRTFPYDYAPTPNLERIANGQVLANGSSIGGGIQFTNAYTNPVCSPTRALLMTGRYAFRTGIASITDLPGPNGSSKLADAETFLPELLNAGLAGKPYACGAFGKWHLTAGSGNDTHAVDNGFDVFQGHIANLTDHYVYRKINAVAGAPVVYEGINGTVHPVTHAFTPSPSPVYSTSQWNAEITTNDATTWINAQSKPFFAYIGYSPPHGAFQVPPHDRLSAATAAQLSNPSNCQGAYLQGMPDTAFDEPDAVLERIFFRSMLEAVDTEIGRLIDGIHPNKLANTMIFVIGDNGTSWPIIDPVHNSEHAKGTVYEWGTHVPFVACGPLVPTTPALAHDCTGLVDSVDLWRTIADITGASVEAAQPLGPVDSLSFLPMLMNPSAQGDRQYSFAQHFSPNGAYTPTAAGPYDPGPPACQPPPPANLCAIVELNVHARSITDGAYRYVRKQITPGLDGSPQGAADTPPVYTEELYDLGADIEELNNLIPTPPLLPSPAVLAILNPLRDAMIELSGY